ncbi:hypothetical protein WAX74_07045 [Psychrobacillus sp. FJAT-51614]|uniref:Type 4 fimbrial biogenesis protein PilX N-terminal domain-containing protein n=1 Tax=Psychrobacillus mangrovi TaxID=3117745 RepID=A0ABU8F381_9BACI
MQVIKNNKGYTLLLTLIIIVVLIILFSSFTLSALSQQKQVENTDDSFEATALAEMGVEYYRAKIINMTHDQGILLALELQNNQKKLPKDRESEETIKIRHMNLLINNIKSLITSDSTHTVDSINNSTKSFKLLKTPNYMGNNSIEIEVQGALLNKKKDITAEFKIPDDLVVPKASDSNNENPMDGRKNLIILPPKPTNLCNGMKVNPCYTSETPDTKSISNIKMWIENTSINFNNDTGKYQNFNSTLYLFGQTTFNHINGSNLNLYSNQNITFDKHVSLVNSKIELAGQLKLNFNSSGNNNKTSFSASTILADGIYINTQNKNYYLNLTNGSKLCLRNKSFSADHNKIKKDNSSFVYILDPSITGKPVNVGTETNTKYVSEVDFKNLCGLTDTSSTEYIINSPTLDNFTKKIIYK